ncbi:PPE family protein, partial [Mycobacterium tuberculosis]|uniref:PPE family protein n=2 Tax=Mycobacterium tuberculosis TaxID=1773 RepID=UPI001F157DD7
GAFISGNYSNGAFWRGDYQGLLGFSSGANVLPVIPLSLDINGGVGAITIEPIHILPDIPININETLYLGPLVVPPINVPAISLGVGIPNISIGPIKINPITLWPAQNFNQTITLAWPVSSITIPQIQQVALSPSPIPTTLIGPIHINTGFSIPVTFSYSTPALTLFPVGLSIPTGGPLTLTLGVTAGTEAFTIPGFSIPEQPLPLAINVIGHINALSTPAITIDNIPLNLHAIGGVGPVDIVGGNVPASPGFGNSTTAPSSGFFNTGAGGVSGFGNVGAHTSGWFNQSTQAMQVLPGTVSGYFNSGTLMSGIGNVGTQLSGMLSGGALGGNNFGLGNIGFDNVGFGNAGSSNFGLANMGIGNIGLANTGNGNIGIGLSGDNLTGFGGFNSGSENVGLFNSGTGNVGFFNSGTGNLGVFNSGSHNTGFFLTGNNINVLAPFTPGTLFTISEIPIDLQVIGGIGPIHVQPIDIPAFDIQITGGFIGIREFTLPEITIPAIPIHVTGTVGLEGFHVNPAFVLFGQTAMAEITADPVVLPDPFITIDHYGPPLGPPGAKFPSGSFYLSISDLQINGPIIGSYGGPGTIPGPFGATFNLSTSSLALFPAGLTVPDQTPVTVNLTGGLDSITLFPGGLAFPENPVVSLTNFSVGTGGFTVFPQGFTVDRIPVDLHTTLSIGPFPFRWDYIPPTPANGPIPAVPGGFGLTSGLFPFHFTLNGGIGPISIPTTTVVDALNPLLTVTGNLEVGPFTVPDIPIPAINFGLDGNVNVSFNAPATTLLSGLGITGSIDISGIQITNIQTQPAQLFMSVGQTLFLFDFRDGIELNPIVIPGSSIPITMAGLSIPLPTVSESIPLNFSFGSPASTVKSMILHEILPIDVSINLEDAVFIPATVLPAIPLNVDVTIPVGPINIPIITEPGSGNSTTTTSDPFSGLAVPGLGVGLLGLFDGSIANNLISGFNSAVGIVGPNVGLSNLGGGNVGLGNVGDFNLGAGNVGGFNVGGGNIGGNNVGLGNVGFGNVGLANSGLTPGLMGLGNIGFGNAGSYNFGLANMGVGNIGFANTGSGNFGIGLTGDNLTGFGGFNTGSGNVGLFNSGTGNVGFFNSGTGNWGVFNSGSYNTGIGNSGIASTGLFNAGGFNTGVVNAGSYNTGSFNAGQANTGGFNPGSVNTGWLNTGDINTGVANSGDVNTGAFISGNYSNGAFWTGDYQGLLDFSFPVGPLIPQTHLVHLRETVNLGPIHIDPIHVHIPPLLDIDQTIDLGSFTVAPITVAPIALDYHETFDLGPLVIFPPMNIPATVIESFSTAPGGPAPPPFVIPATSNVFISTVDFATGNNVIGPFSGALAPTTIQLGASGPSFSVLNLSIPPIHIPGLTIPSVPLRIDVDGGIPGFTLFPDGLTFPKIPVHVDAFAGIPDFTIFPNGYTIDPIPLQLNLDLTLGPVHILIDLPAVPGFGNTTGAPSSGFFNSGAGGVSGFGNVGAMVSGGWNQAPSALLGGGSGVFNAGTLHSGVLNFGSGMSGLFNTSVLGLGAPALVSGLGSVGQQLSGLLASGTALHQGLVLNFGLADVGLGNVGLGNVGDFNLGAGNVGGFNVGGGNIGGNNVGLGNVGFGNVGLANSGLTPGLMGLGNIGFGNAGSYNFGLANMGVGNIGFANTGSGNFGIGLTGDNLTGFGGFNTGSGNVGLFNSGTGNVGFFNSGTGNWGVFNSGSYNTGIGNSGIASTGLFNAGGFNTGVVNAGSYNTGSFNAGQANTGGFNPGSVNTGWLNTGDTNTGVANSGDVNTGAFISGNYSNGAFWRGDYQGLLGFSYRPAVLPQTPFLDLTLTGGLGSVVIPAIDIPAIRPEFSANVAIDSFTVPSIPIPQIDLAATTVSVGLGPITVPHLDIPRVPVTLNYLFGSQPGGPLKIGPITGLFNTPIGLTPLALSQIVIGASSSQGTITAFLANLPFSTPVVTIDEIPLLASITGHSEPVDIFPGGLTIPAMNPLSINLSGGTGAVTIPAITIGEIPFDLVAHSTLGPVHILIDLPAVPGFGNTTGAPSSGFFNSGAGGVSGFGNVGAMVSGGWNQAPSALLGGGSGVFNAGTLHSGVLNFGSGMSGLFNTSVLGLGAPALVSGLGSVGQQLSGLLASGTALHQGLVLNFGLADVGLGNVGLGNVGDFNLGAGNVGGFNVGGGNIGGNNVGLGNVGWGNFGLGNSGLTPGLMGLGNIGFGNAGSYNFGLANMGVGNIGFANTGSGNFGIGLTGDNLTGFGGFNTGSGNVGLFNSGTGNVGFFNSGTGNWGVFNSGSYNTGIGNSGIASTGLFNAGGFNTGVVNAGSYNTGSFNAGQANTGGFNPGSVNTGWLNTGDTNTGVANSGDVNTGAFISGNYSNGAFWRGDYQGLLGFSYTSTIIPEFTVANIHASGGAGPIIVPSIQFPAIPLDLSATGHIGGFTIPPVSISPITVRIDPVFDLGPITVQDITIPALGLDPATGVTVGPIFSSGSIIDPFSLTLLGFINVNVPAIQTAPSEILPFTVLLSSLGVTHLTPEITIPGFHIPVDPIHVELPLSVTIGPFVSPEITIPQLPLGLALSGATPAFAFPLEITIDRIPVVLDVNALLGPINAGLVIPPVPGFGNTTAVPSSGFFNIGGGGGLSGFHNLGAGMSGVLNAISDPLLGSASGFANFGTQLSGILNRGADISGVYNTGALGLITSALVSGFGNVGQQLAGLIYTGTGP